MEDELFFLLNLRCFLHKKNIIIPDVACFSPLLMDRKWPPPTSGSRGTLSCKLRIVKISLLLVMYVLTQQWRQGNVFALNIGMLPCNRVVLRHATCWENFSPSLLHPSFGQARLSGKRSNSQQPCQNFFGGFELFNLGWSAGMLVENLSAEKTWNHSMESPS